MLLGGNGEITLLRPSLHPSPGAENQEIKLKMCAGNCPIDLSSLVNNIMIVPQELVPPVLVGVYVFEKWSSTAQLQSRG